jgi:branched-chain amino acid transport system permease protein
VGEATVKKIILRVIRHPMFWVFLFFLVLPYLLPFVGGYTYLGVEVLIWSIFALGYNILLGYTGLPSFGHGAFFGIGAFVAGIMQLRVVQGMWIPILTGVFAATFFGALVGLFLARKRGIYFALLTIAFSQMFWFISWGWDKMTGGEDGLSGINRLPVGIPGLFSIDLKDILNFYYFVYILFVICTILIWIIVRSPFGKTLQAIRYNEIRAKCIGYDTPRYKWLSFTISCAFSGLAGTLYVLLRNAAFSDVMHWTQSGNVIMMVLLGGGLANFYGPILGAGVFIVLRDLFSTLTEHWLLIYGLLFMFVIVFIPEGILSFFKKRQEKEELLVPRE